MRPLIKTLEEFALSKKANPLLILLLPVAMLWSCISGLDDERSPKVAPANYTTRVDTPVWAEASPERNTPTHLPAAETESKIDE